MRHIDKTEPAWFAEWKNKFKNKSGRKPHYDDLGDIKIALRKDISIEQNGLCCYCCGQLHEGQSHIEHIKPKSGQYSDFDLDYSNLLVSCTVKGGNSHCGMKKGHCFDEELFVSPLEETCSEHFTYRSISGFIDAVEGDKRAAYTIECLGLDSVLLVKARREAYFASCIYSKSKADLESYIKILASKTCAIPYCDMLLCAAEERLNDIREESDNRDNK